MTKNNKDNKDEAIEDEEFDEEDSQEGKYLSFRLANEQYGIEIKFVTEIVGQQKITEVPDMPQFVKGVINLRGSVIPVVDVRLRFKMQPRDYDDRTCVIVVESNETSVGLVVDTVNEVIDIPADKVSAPPQVAQEEVKRYINGIGRLENEVIILLSIEKLLYEHFNESNKAKIA